MTPHREFTEGQLVAEKAYVLELKDQLNNTTAEATIAKEKEMEALQPENAASALLTQEALEREEERE